MEFVCALLANLGTFVARSIRLFWSGEFDSPWLPSNSPALINCRQRDNYINSLILQLVNRAHDEKRRNKNSFNVMNCHEVGKDAHHSHPSVPLYCLSCISAALSGYRHGRIYVEDRCNDFRLPFQFRLPPLAWNRLQATGEVIWNRFQITSRVIWNRFQANGR